MTQPSGIVLILSAAAMLVACAGQMRSTGGNAAGQAGTSGVGAIDSGTGGITSGGSAGTSNGGTAQGGAAGGGGALDPATCTTQDQRPLPDATARLLAPVCKPLSDERVELSAVICNRGLAALPAGLHGTFYSERPNLRIPLCSIETTESIAGVGNCKPASCVAHRLQLLEKSLLRFIVNDPPTVQECNEFNNDEWLAVENCTIPTL